MSLEQRKNKAREQSEEVAEKVQELRRDVESAFKGLYPYDMDEAMKGNLVPNPEFMKVIEKKEKEVKKSLKELEGKALKVAKFQGDTDRENERMLMKGLSPSEGKRAYDSGFQFVMDRHYQNASSVVQSLLGAARSASSAGISEAVEASERIYSLQKEIESKR